MGSGLESKGLLDGLDETRQLARLKVGRTGTHVEFYPVNEHEAHPGFSL